MKSVRIFFIPLVITFCCGFTWGFRKKDPCMTAKEVINSAMSMQGGMPSPSAR